MIEVSRSLTRQSLRYGTEVIVDRYHAKDHSLKRTNGRDITFTDGRDGVAVLLVGHYRRRLTDQDLALRDADARLEELDLLEAGGS